MGLDTTHDCWHGPYSSFNDWRRTLFSAAGYSNLDEMEGFGGCRSFAPIGGDVLLVLVNHSDCDGDIPADKCATLADRLEQLMPWLPAGDMPGDARSRTLQFISGLRDAAGKGEPVVFS